MKKTIASLQASPTLTLTRHAHSLRAVVFSFPSPSTPATQANSKLILSTHPLNTNEQRAVWTFTTYQNYFSDNILWLPLKTMQK